MIAVHAIPAQILEIKIEFFIELRFVRLITMRTELFEHLFEKKNEWS